MISKKQREEEEKRKSHFSFVADDLSHCVISIERNNVIEEKNEHRKK